MKRLLMMLVWLAMATQTQAGGWPREQGTGFVAVTTKLGFSGSESWQTHQIYAEYGLPRRITIGVDLYHSPHWDDGQILAFLRAPLSQSSSTHQFAATLALGWRQDTVEAPVVRGSLNWGKGLGNGWLAADFHVSHLPGLGQTELKLETIWGTRRGAWSLMAGVVAEHDLQSTPELQFTPAIAWQVSERLQLLVAADVALGGNTDPALRLGTWITF